jgi:hypothetical protein
VRASASSAHCDAETSQGHCSISWARPVPRRTNAQVKVAPAAQPQPPNRILASADRKYVATTPTCTQRSAQPAASLGARSRHPARPTVGSTASATTMAKWSWSTLL